MATGAVGLPPGFELEPPPAASGLPPGFELEPPPAKAPGFADNFRSLTDNPGVGGAELLLHHLTGALAPVLGIAAGSGASVGKLLGANVDPNKVQSDTENMFTYAPASASGKAGLEGERQIGEAVAPVTKPIADAVNAGIDKTGAAAPYMRAAGKGALTALQFAAPGGGKAAGEALLPEAAVEGAAKPVVGVGKDAIETGRSAGFKFTPGGVESRMPAAAAEGDVPQSFAVTPDDRRAVNLHNQALATDLAGEQIGKKGAAKGLSAADYDEARKPHKATYEATGTTLGSGLTGSGDFQSALTAKLEDQTPTKLPPAVATQAQRVLKAAQSGNMSGPQMVKDISWFRANGGRSVAKMLEDEMEGQLGANSPQLDKFREARTGFAQIKNLQDVTSGGQIDANALARLDKKYPGLLTGNLKLIAQTAAAAPQDFRLPSGVQPGSSPISKPTWAGAAKAVAGKVAKVAIPSRFDVTSDAFQNRFGRLGTEVENSYRSGLGKRPPAPSQGFALQAPPGSAAIPARQGEMTLPEGQQPAPRIDLQAPEGNVGVNPVQLGMQIAQGRPLEEQRLALKPTAGTIEPHQPSLLGHEGTPEGGSRSKPKAKKRGKD